MNAENAIDKATIDELKELLADDYTELVERYIEDSGNRMQRIGKSIADKDLEALYSEAHGVKGSSQNLGAHKLAAICATLEKIGMCKEEGDIEQLFAAAEQEFAAVCEFLKTTLD